VIAHADSVEGRQPMRVLNWKEEEPRWELNTNTSIDIIPQTTPDTADMARQCCDKFIEQCRVEAEKCWNSFKRKLTDVEVERLRTGHWSCSETGEEYPVEPPASRRS